MPRARSILPLLLAALLAPAQPSAQQQPPPPVVCAQSMWTCIARCIARECAQRCAEPCAGAIRALRSCRRAAHCARGDVRCERKACPQQCDGVFGALPAFQAQVAPPPCMAQGPAAPGLPRELVGVWEMRDASFVRQNRETDEALIRGDYGLRLRITPQGCIVIETHLGAATLSEGNGLDLQVWGRVQMLGEREWKTVREGGTLTGEACGEPRSAQLGSEGGRTLHVTYDLDGDILWLTPVASTRVNALSFERVKPQGGR